MKVIISGGGTGGHIFPAISIANAIRQKDASAQILFVGALGRMEMEKVPAAGYEIIGLPVAGFQRKLSLKNLTFFFKLAASMMKARKIIRSFKPDVVIGVGGYASGPVLRTATSFKIPTLIQEQNSFPGVTNKILSKKVNTICVAYPGMERFFPAEKTILTGNPVRQNLLDRFDREAAAKSLGIRTDRKTILVIGGSQGARSINTGVLSGISQFVKNDIQVIWQTGQYYYVEMAQALPASASEHIKVLAFIQNMNEAYGLADLIISRAGASSISEIALLGKPAIFVPSPNVAEDHQTKNAMALVNESAGVMVRDSHVEDIALEAINLLNDPQRLEEMKKNVKKFAKPYAATEIADEVFKLIKR